MVPAFTVSDLYADTSLMAFVTSAEIGALMLLQCLSCFSDKTSIVLQLKSCLMQACH